MARTVLAVNSGQRTPLLGFLGDGADWTLLLLTSSRLKFVPSGMSVPNLEQLLLQERAEFRRVACSMVASGDLERIPFFVRWNSPRNGTPRGVGLPGEWNSQGSGPPRGVELPGGGTRKVWNSQQVEPARVELPGGRGVELPEGGTRKSEIQLAGRFSKANSGRWAPK